jgi:hypothetical protein
MADPCLVVPDGRAKHSDDRRFTVGKARTEIRQGGRGQEESDMIGCDQVDEAFDLLASIGCQVVHCLALPLGNSVNKRRLARQCQSVELFGPLQNCHWGRGRTSAFGENVMQNSASEQLDSKRWAISKSEMTVS